MLLARTTSYTAFGSGFILQKHVVYVYTGSYTSIRTCSAIHHGWLCVPREIADDKLSGFSVPYRTAIRSGLTYVILGAIRTYMQY